MTRRCPYDRAMRNVLVFVVVVGLVGLGVFVAAGRLPGPSIQIVAPGRFVGASTPLDVVVQSPGGRLAGLTIDLEQNGTSTRVLASGDSTSATHLSPDGDDRIRVTHTIGRDNVPGLKSGAATVVVTAARPVLYGLRAVTTRVRHDVQVRLERPTVSVISTHHYINQGGSEMVVYRVSPPDVQSGVVVGHIEYPGYPAAGVTADAVTITDPTVRVAFFALLYNQDVSTPIHLFARDEAGNSARADFDYRTFPKPARQSRIVLDDTFLDRVVPAILSGTTAVKPEGSPLDKFLVINSQLRQLNAAKIASFASVSAPELLWRGVVFHPFTNSAVESAFADRRTYVYEGRDVDHQVHLGFDLASFARTPVVAANRGKVVFADELGIYGNCVILDHGMGVQSLYGHLSQIGVTVGDMVEKEQVIGRSGMTGLAGGDHLHFTMLVNGQMVNPVEWWDPHWIQDRILRKLRDAR
jgi:murein DD-endopeptidase MepM/ murein hydrolase activator NlpD